MIPPKPNYLDDEIYSMCRDVFSKYGNSCEEGFIILKVYGDEVFENLRKMGIDCLTSEREWCFNELGIFDFSENNEELSFSFKVFLITVTVKPREKEILIKFPTHEKVDACVYMSSLAPFIKTLMRLGAKFELKQAKVAIPVLLKLLNLT